MINLIGIIILMITEAVVIMAFFTFIKHKLEIKDNDIDQRDKLLGERMQIIREKNKTIEELQNEINELKRKNNRGL